MLSGVGLIQAVPAASTNGTPLGTQPANALGARFYLPANASVTYTIAAAQPASAPTMTMTVSASTGPNFDEALTGGVQIFVTATSGTPLFRWY